MYHIDFTSVSSRLSAGVLLPTARSGRSESFSRTCPVQKATRRTCKLLDVGNNNNNDDEDNILSIITDLSQLGLFFRFRKLFFQIRPHADLAVHHARRREIAQQVFQLKIYCAEMVKSWKYFFFLLLLNVR